MSVGHTGTVKIYYHMLFAHRESINKARLPHHQFITLPTRNFEKFIGNIISTYTVTIEISSMPLADSDLIDDIVFDKDAYAEADTRAPLVIAATNDDSNRADGCGSPKASYDDQISTPMSNVTASTTGSNEESVDNSPRCSPDAPTTMTINEEQLLVPGTVPTTTTKLPHEPTLELPQEPTLELPQQPTLVGSSITISQPLSDASEKSNNRSCSTKTLYSLRLPGVGKILAINSEQSCDVDALYEQEKKACDVDAYLDADDTDDDDSELPLYSSMENQRCKSMTEKSTVTMEDNEFDLEANRASIVSIIRRIDPPLDPHCDPFAQRVGKTLSWRNVNMTLVRLEVLDEISAFLFVLILTVLYFYCRKRSTEKRSC
jgi:hypothetical protein